MDKSVVILIFIDLKIKFLINCQFNNFHFVNRRFMAIFTQLFKIQKMKYFFYIIVFLISFNVVAQDKLPYQLYDKNGKKTTYKKMLKQAENAEVVLFGEHHHNSIVHWLQLEFTKDLFEKKALILGAEMIEADNQKQLNQYLA